MKVFAIRLYAPPAPGQIGPQQRGFLLKDTSLARAKRLAKQRADTEQWRLVEIFEVQESEVPQFIKHGWREVNG